MRTSDSLQSDTVGQIQDRFNQLYRQRLGLEGAVALHDPWFAGNEWAYVKDCLDTGWVSSVGSYVDRFEADLARITGAKFAVATVNGTSALHVVLHALGVGDGDLVICPALSFVATANAIAYCGAEPLFIDVDGCDLGMDPGALTRLLEDECDGCGASLRHRPSGRRVAAILLVHLFGHPAQVEAISELCAARGLPLVEDAAEALGSRRGQRGCGTFGLAGVLSFNGNKTLTTGGGGAILTDDQALAGRLKHLTTTARVSQGWSFGHDELGFNYRLPNINAALGCAQLESLPRFLRRKRKLAELVGQAFAGQEDLSVIAEPAGARSNYWLNGLVMRDGDLRDRLLEATNRSGLQTRACWPPLPDLPVFRNAPQAASGVAVARDLAARILNIPSGPRLVDDDAP